MNTLIDQALQGGKYTLDEAIEQDGFSITFQASQHPLGRTVLIKTLNEAAQQAPNFTDYQRTFQAEAQRLAMCVHPNISKIHDFFIEDNLPYIVIDRIPGQTLHEIVFPDRPLSEAIAIRYIRQIGEALKVIHLNGLLHRDITPNHIVLHPKTQEAVLIDFGIAHEFGSESADTQTALISAGGYASVEQYLAPDRLTPASDVYGLAATLYALLTAKEPITSMLRQHQTLPPPRHLRPELSPAVNQAVMSGMALDSCHRPSTVTEWLSLLPNVEAPQPSTLSRRAIRSVNTPLPQVAASRTRSQSWPRGNQVTPQLMTGIVPTNGFDRRWLTSGAMVFGVVLTLVATAGLLLKYYSPEQTIPLLPTSDKGEDDSIPLWQELGIPPLKQQSPASTDFSVPNPSIPDTSTDTLEDPLFQPLQPLIDPTPIPELLLEELIPLTEDLNATPTEASPAKTAPKIVDEWEAPTTVEPTPEASQTVDDLAPPTSEDLTVDAPPTAEAAPTTTPSSPLPPEPAPYQEVSPDNLEASPDNPEVSPDNLEVSPDNLEVSPDNPEVSPDNLE